MGAIRYFIFLAFVLGALGFIIYQIVKFALSISGKQSQITRDVKSLRDNIDPYMEQLVPLDSEELPLFSLNQIDRKSTKTIHSITTGVFTSIYQEPLLAYAYKQYAGSDYKVIIAQTYNDEYMYISRGDRTDVYLNDDAIGYMMGSDRLYSMAKEGHNLIANIAADKALSSHPIYVGDREVGEVNNPMRLTGPTPRAFQCLEQMHDQEQKYFLALSFLSIILESNYDE